MFNLLKESFRMIRNINKYQSMSTEELGALGDEELRMALLTRVEFITNQFENDAEGLQQLNEAQQIFYAATQYEMEVNNGGLCQYFVNSSRYTAPYLVHALEEIGAPDAARQFATFVEENGIDVSGLSSFILDDIDEFDEQNERYPFDEFDDHFYESTVLEDKILRYAREHLEAL